MNSRQPVGYHKILNCFFLNPLANLQLHFSISLIMVLHSAPLTHLPGNLLSFNLCCDLLLNSFLTLIQDHFSASALIVSLCNFNNNRLTTAGKTLKFKIGSWEPVGDVTSTPLPCSFCFILF